MTHMSDADWRAMDEACHADAHRFRLFERRHRSYAARAKSRAETTSLRVGGEA